jgi:hypothetical protein
VLYVAALAFLKMSIALMLLTSLFGKRDAGLFDLVKTDAASENFLAILERVHGPFIIALVYLLFDAAPLFALSMLGAMMLTGYLMKQTGTVSSCNCYGSLAVAGSNRAAVLNALLLTMSVATLALTLLPASVAPEWPLGQWLFLLSLILAPVAAWASNLKRNSPRLGDLKLASTEVGEYGFKHDGEMPVGHLQSGETVRLSQIAATCPMILFIAVSSECSACATFKPMLLTISEAFGFNLRTVFLVEGPVDDGTELRNTLMLRSNATFVASLGGVKYPFATVMNSGALVRIGSIEYGENIAALLLRLLSLTNHRYDINASNRET